MHPTSKFTGYVLQAMRSGIWVDVDNRKSLEGALNIEESWRKREPTTSFRVQSEFVYSPTNKVTRKTVIKHRGVPEQRKGN